MDIKIKNLSCIANKEKKSRLLNGSLDFTGTDALRTDMKFTCLSAAYIYSNVLNVNKPTASCMSLGVADGISRRRSATTAITELGHFNSPLITWNNQPVHCIIVFEKVATIRIGGF